MTPASHKHSPLRPAFRIAQRREAAAAGFITDEHRRTRQHIITHPIDNVPPGVASDRDDGIFVEAQPVGKGYRVHVTIADVAAHVPLAGELAKVAHERTFTIYRPWMTDPQFPKPFEDRVSLEHGQERLGLTISMDLDERFRPVHTEFTPTLTRGDNTDYDMATERMLHDPQFRLMAHIAKGVRQNLQARHMPELAWQKQERARNLSGQQLEARKLVETFMLLANEQTARFFSESGLPFLYRNYDESTLDHDGIARASYSTKALAHTHLANSGWNGRYCHITSPIRRGADFLNQHMQHYAIGVIGQLEAELLHMHPGTAKETLHHSLWHHAPQLFSLLGNAQGHISHERRGRLTDWLAARLEDAGCSHIDTGRLGPVIDTLGKARPPLSRKQLDHYADEINRRNHAERLDELDMRRREREAERHGLRLTRLADITAGDQHTDEQFSALLRDAALTGILPEPLRNEALERINEGRFHRSADGLSIMVIARYPADPAWNQLKRAMARIIKNDPAAVNNILDMADAGGYLGGTLTIGETSLPLHETQDLPERERNIQGAIMVLQEHNNGTIAPPYYSVGHDARSASSHAKYSFLEHYAFGQLQPLAQSSIPNLLYAELGDDERSRHSIVEQMCHKLGAKLALTRNTLAEGDVLLTATVTGGQVKSPIITTVSLHEVKSEAKLETSVLRRLLRHPAFKDATQFDTVPELHDALHPREYLEKRAAQAGGSVTIATEEKRLRGGHTQFTARLSLLLPDAEPQHLLSRGPNKDRAIHDAATAMLRQNGWAVPLAPTRARAWVNDEDAKTAGTGAGHAL